MAKRLVITEEQYKNLIKEGVTLKADVDAANGDVKKAIDTTKQEAAKSGIKLDNATIEVPANEGPNEGKVVKLSALKESRLKVLKENSQLYTVKDFMKNLIK